MSRHRDVRNLDAEDFEDDSYGSSYGSSYVDEVPLSTSMENYMYRRGSGGAGGSGHTPKMGHFVLGRSDSVPSVPEEEDGEETSGPMRERSDSETSSGSNTDYDLSDADQKKLSQCLEDVLDIMGDTMPEHLVKEAIVRCDFNSEVAVNTLLNNPVKSRVSQAKAAAARIRPAVVPDPTDTSSVTPSIPIASSSSASAASAAAVVRTLPQTVKAKKPTKIIDVPMDTDSSDITTSQQPPQPAPVSRLLPKPTSANNRSRSQSPAPPTPQGPPPGFSAPVARNSESTPGKTVNMRKAKVDALEVYGKERGGGKDQLNLVVVGHVDSGKSTLMGHLLFELGSVSSKIMHKYEQESKKLGKQSFAYAWVLDETSEERERGITMDVGQNRFETPTKSITLLDAPGHKDFIPNMISGAYQADVAILVVNATRGEFEAGFDSGGQTREHALLVRSLGVAQLIVAVNKLDTVDWSQSRFEEIRQKLKAFLRTVGFKEADVTYVPCSGFTGDNLAKQSDKLSQWYEGRTLLSAIDNFKPQERLVEKPFRMSISDVFKPQSSGFCVAGRIEAGFVLKDDKVLLMPLAETAVVKSVLVEDAASTGSAFAGDHVSLVLSGPEQTSVSAGMVACDPARPIQPSRRFRARVVVFGIDMPLTKGFPVVLHHGCVQAQATIKKLVALVNKSTGEVVKNKPRCLTKNCSALVDIAVDPPVCLELYSNIKELGRFMLRSGGKTIAAGIVTEFL